ncbi:MAG TPA: hypothetical protein VLX29_11595, partial [Nitrospirota bacterium]|nr:hypothetical protein [Nitrospirota bacterium]
MIKRIIITVGIVIVCTATPAWAQELIGLGGALYGTPTRETTYTWQLEYLEGLGEHFAYSFTYLNEGHL